MDEHAQIGAKALAEFLNIPLDTVKKRLIPNMKKVGVVFEVIRGRPPAKRLMWFPSSVRAFMAATQRIRNEEKAGGSNERKERQQ